jgi:heat shock protein HslJ
MKKIPLIILGTCAVVVLLIVLAGMYKFNYLASLPGYDVDGNKIEATDTFEVIEVLGQSCQTDNDCETPAEYAIQSNCPYDSVCIENKCTVICPAPFTGSRISDTGPKDATYMIDEEPVTLLAGVSETATVPASAAKTTTRYFGNEVRADLNGDGREDGVFLLTQETGGSGTFFYMVAALDTENGWVGSEGYFLGDRIAPQTTHMSTDPNHQNVIVVTYADRKDGQPLSEPPSVGTSVWLKFDVDSMTFGEVTQNFEGEADPDIMNLSMKPWTWAGTQYNNDTESIPNETGPFTLTFSEDGSVSATTDCNAMSGTYELSGNQITFGPMAMTRMFCPDSQEQEFAAMLKEVQSYFFTSKGELIFEFKYDSGTAAFR